MLRRAAGTSIWRGAAFLAALLGPSASAHAAAPGDVYYKVHVDQEFKYYVFAQDVVVWESQDLEGTSLSSAFAHDTTETNATSSVSSSFDAGAGTLTADLDSQIQASAQFGIFHQLYNSLSVQVYIKGSTGTPYHVRVTDLGQVDVSRLGGLPGSLQPVNGTSTASFADSTATIAATGSVSLPVNDLREFSGNSTTQITVGADTYSYAGTYRLSAGAQVTQTLCVLGCMRAPADFDAHGSGHVQIDVYPNQDPTDAPRRPAPPSALALQVSPNPLRASTLVSFLAPAGERTQVQVFDVRGRLVSRIYDAAATGGVQRLSWRASGVPSGLYFLRVQTGAKASTEKVTLLR
ncbi:MAG: T9SS type A sorting domain-containing protein [bacterium]